MLRLHAVDGALLDTKGRETGHVQGRLCYLVCCRELSQQAPLAGSSQRHATATEDVIAEPVPVLKCQLLAAQCSQAKHCFTRCE